MGAMGRLLCPLRTKLFQFPSLVTISIAATRLHRALVDYAYGSTEMFDMLRFLPSLHSLFTLSL